jgi:uncharacterized protein YndB with AHSA1/START domain
MERKTKINAEHGQPDLLITREFDLPVELLFRAYVEPELIEQWMGTRVLIHESKKHGSYQLETTHDGKVVFRANGVIHAFSPNEKIVRTFEMENAPFGVQLELLRFERLSAQTSKLLIHTIFESVALRDQMMKLPFAQGLNMAHDRLQAVAGKSNEAL